MILKCLKLTINAYPEILNFGVGDESHTLLYTYHQVTRKSVNEIDDEINELIEECRSMHSQNPEL